jgi:hypothetical protein
VEGEEGEERRGFAGLKISWYLENEKKKGLTWIVKIHNLIYLNATYSTKR